MFISRFPEGWLCSSAVQTRSADGRMHAAHGDRALRLTCDSGSRLWDACLDGRNELFEVGFPNDTHWVASSDKFLGLAVFGRLLVSGKPLDISVANYEQGRFLCDARPDLETNRSCKVRCAGAGYFECSGEYDHLACELSVCVAIPLYGHQARHRTIADGLSDTIKHLVDGKATFAHCGEQDVPCSLRVGEGMVVFERISDPLADSR